MGTIMAIVRREMGSFFSTWMGYIVAAATLFIDGLLFNSFAVGKEPRFSADVLGEFFYLTQNANTARQIQMLIFFLVLLYRVHKD